MPDSLDQHAQAYRGNLLYDFDNDILLNWYSRRIVVLEEGASSLLELGLGHGLTAGVFGGHFKEYTVLDGSPAVIESFRAHHPQCQARIVHTLFEEYTGMEMYDVVVLGFVLEHVEAPVPLIRRYLRHVRPGGCMYVAVPNAEVLNRRLGHLAGMLPDLQQLSANDLLLGHRRYYTRQSLAADIASAGCEIERTEGIYLKPFTTTQMLSLALDQKVIRALCEVGVDYPDLCCGIMMSIRR